MFFVNIFVRRGVAITNYHEQVELTFSGANISLLSYLTFFYKFLTFDYQ